MRCGLREANQNFSRLIKAVRRSEEVVLTDRGKPFARLARIKPRKTRNEDEDLDELLDRLAAEGKVTRATKKGPLPPVKPIKLKSGKSIVEALREERDSYGW